MFTQNCHEDGTFKFYLIMRLIHAIFATFCRKKMSLKKINTGKSDKNGILRKFPYKRLTDLFDYCNLMIM